LVIGLYLFNREAIRSSLAAIRNEISANRNIQSEKPEEESGTGENVPPPAVTITVPAPDTDRSSSQTQQRPTATQTVTPAPSAQTAPQTQSSLPRTTPDPIAQTSPQTPQTPASQNNQGQTSQSQPTGQSQVTGQSSQSAGSQTDLRDRAIYFIHVDRGGSILREKVNRKLPVSDSPMTDAIQAIISGPNGEEKSKGLISLIPPNTRILSATVRDDTAYISFSEDFQYNTYGVEGYAGQLRQIVFTATEFSNIKNVQILIEGRRIDYLGEGIWIGSPLNRDML